MEKLFTAKEAAEILRMHEKSIKKWIRDGKIAGTMVGKRYLIRESELDKLMG